MIDDEERALLLAAQKRLQDRITDYEHILLACGMLPRAQSYHAQMTEMRNEANRRDAGADSVD